MRFGMQSYLESPQTAVTYIMTAGIFATILGLLLYGWYRSRDYLPISPGVIAGCLAFTAFLLISQGVYETVYNRRMHQWPACQGEITVSEMTEESVPAKGSAVPRVYYHAAIQYRFTVQGVTYEGHRVGLAELSSTDPEDVKQVLEKYPVGAAVSPAYDPDDPGKSLLEVPERMPLLHWQSLALASFFLLFAAPFYYEHRRGGEFYLSTPEVIDLCQGRKEKGDTKTVVVWNRKPGFGENRYVLFEGDTWSSYQLISKKPIAVVFKKADVEKIRWCSHIVSASDDPEARCKADKLLVPDSRVRAD